MGPTWEKPPSPGLLPLSDLGVAQPPSSWLDPVVWLGQMEPEESGEVCLGRPKGEKQRQDEASAPSGR